MGWKQQYRQGSFRGISFLIDTADSEFGRRVAEHEFPQQDIPFSEDLGRSMRKFSIDCFVLGDDYLTQRDNLVAAAEKKGTGLLIHPYFGNVNVICKSLKVRDSKDETRIARMQFVFTETGDLKFPSTLIDTKANVTASSISAFTKLQAFFLKTYSVAKLPYKATQDVLKVLSLATTAVQDARQDISQVANFRQSLGIIAQTLIDLVNAPADLALALMDALSFGIFDTSAVDFVPDRKTAFLKISALYTFNPPISYPSTASTSVTQFMQIAATLVNGSLLSLIDYKSADEAISFRDSIFAQIDSLLFTSIDDDTFIALEDLRMQAEIDIETRVATLSKITTVVIPQITCSLALSNRLYGSTDLESDILSRNGIHHPGFIPAAVPLKVLISE